MPSLNWLTREEDIRAVEQVPYRLLEEVPSLSAGDRDSGNILIQGDNLEALKALLPFYAGSVKCIYIDPPYNTKSAFEHFDDNLEHARWLAMMWPRLELLRELLAEDGSIWVSIDDNEGHYLKVVMDEIFGRTNFIATFVWERDAGGRGDAAVSVSHDFLLCYARRSEIWKKTRNLLQRTETQARRFRNPDNDARGPWRQGDDGTAKSGTERQRFEIELPSGRIVTPKPGRYWAFSEDTFRKARAEGRVYFGKNGDRLPIIKRYISSAREGVAPRTWWSAGEAGTNQSAKRDHLRKVMPELEPFATPKPEELVSRVIKISSNPGDIVLDSFLGSGTTAAVALKMNRKFICNELNEPGVRYCLTRLGKVIDGEQGGISESIGWQGGGGFRFYRLGPPAFDAEGKIGPHVGFAILAAHIWFAETSRPWEGPWQEGLGTTLIGIHDGRAWALLYNGVLEGQGPDGGSVLTRATLGVIRQEIAGSSPGFDGPLTVYAERTRLTHASLSRERIEFKQTPYDVKARR